MLRNFWPLAGLVLLTAHSAELSDKWAYMDQAERDRRRAACPDEMKQCPAGNSKVGESYTQSMCEDNGSCNPCPPEERDRRITCGCTGMPTGCSKASENCLSDSSDTPICQECDEGYHLRHHECLECQGTPKGCATAKANCLDENYKECAACEQGYVLQNGVCVACTSMPQNCAQAHNMCQQDDTSLKMCQICGTGFQVDSTGNCMQCVEPDRSECIRSTDSCVPNADLPVLQCAQCELNYFKNAKGECLKCEYRAKFCETVGDTCDQFDDKVVQLCDQCLFGYFNDGGLCKECNQEPFGCQSPTGDMACLTNTSPIKRCNLCANGFYEPSGQGGTCKPCTIIPTGCQQPMLDRDCLDNGAQKCEVCNHEAGYTETGTGECRKCTATPFHCDTPETECHKTDQIKKCAICSNGYYRTPCGKCKAAVPGAACECETGRGVVNAENECVCDGLYDINVLGRTCGFTQEADWMRKPGTSTIAKGECLPMPAAPLPASKAEKTEAQYVKIDMALKFGKGPIWSWQGFSDPACTTATTARKNVVTGQCTTPGEEPDIDDDETETTPEIPETPPIEPAEYEVCDFGDLFAALLGTPLLDHVQCAELKNEFEDVESGEEADLGKVCPCLQQMDLMWATTHLACRISPTDDATALELYQSCNSDRAVEADMCDPHELDEMLEALATEMSESSNVPWVSACSTYSRQLGDYVDAVKAYTDDPQNSPDPEKVYPNMCNCLGLMEETWVQERFKCFLPATKLNAHNGYAEWLYCAAVQTSTREVDMCNSNTLATMRESIVELTEASGDDQWMEVCFQWLKHLNGFLDETMTLLQDGTGNPMKDYPSNELFCGCVGLMTPEWMVQKLDCFLPALTYDYDAMDMYRECPNNDATVPDETPEEEGFSPSLLDSLLKEARSMQDDEAPADMFPSSAWRRRLMSSEFEFTDSDLARAQLAYQNLKAGRQTNEDVRLLRSLVEVAEALEPEEEEAVPDEFPEERVAQPVFDYGEPEPLAREEEEEDDDDLEIAILERARTAYMNLKAGRETVEDVEILRDVVEVAAEIEERKARAETARSHYPHHTNIGNGAYSDSFRGQRPLNQAYEDWRQARATPPDSLKYQIDFTQRPVLTPIRISAMQPAPGSSGLYGYNPLEMKCLEGESTEYFTDDAKACAYVCTANSACQAFSFPGRNVCKIYTSPTKATSCDETLYERAKCRCKQAGVSRNIVCADDSAVMVCKYNEVCSKSEEFIYGEFAGVCSATDAPTLAPTASPTVPPKAQVLPTGTVGTKDLPGESNPQQKQDVDKDNGNLCNGKECGEVCQFEQSGQDMMWCQADGSCGGGAKPTADDCAAGFGAQNADDKKKAKGLWLIVLFCIVMVVGCFICCCCLFQREKESDLDLMKDEEPMMAKVANREERFIDTEQADEHFNSNAMQTNDSAGYSNMIDEDAQKGGTGTHMMQQAAPVPSSGPDSYANLPADW